MSSARARARRFVRVAKGLTNSSSRSRYVAEARRRLRKGERQAAGDGERCLVCRTARVRHKTITYAKNKEKVCQVGICGHCGYISIPKHTKSDYRAKKHLDELPLGGRAGTLDRPGREFHMTRMALDILDRGDLEVLVYGAGRSFDNHHIQRLPRVRNVAIGDIMKLRDDAEFIDANQPAPRQFPIVIASEVIEHFRDPRDDFAKLFKFVQKDGLIVCGTNIYDGGDLAQDRYIHFPDHTSYYTPEALRRIARDAGFSIDFRSPGLGSVRKRYVLFTKSPGVLESVACYFGSHTYAPSETRPARSRRTRREKSRRGAS